MTYRAPIYPMSVVSCKAPQGIFRAIASFANVGEMVDRVVRQIGLRNLAGTEWTGFIYGLPAYAVDPCYPPGGIYLWSWRRPPGPEDPLGVTHPDPVLLERPIGWAAEGSSVFTLPREVA